MRAIFLAFFVFAMSALAVDVSGKWWGDAVTDGNAQPVYITLVQQGDALKGSGGPSPTNQDLLTNGRIEGKRITFDVVPGGRTPLHFELVDEGEWLKGTVKVKHNGQTVTGTVAIRRRSN